MIPFAAKKEDQKERENSSNNQEDRVGERGKSQTTDQKAHIEEIEPGD